MPAQIPAIYRELRNFYRIIDNKGARFNCHLSGFERTNHRPRSPRQARIQISISARCVVHANDWQQVRRLDQYNLL